MTKVLKVDSYIKRYIRHPLIGHAISFPLDQLFRARNWVLCPKKIKFYQTEDLSAFDQRFDAFWEKMKATFTLVGERTSNYLNWRFVQSPYKKYSVFTLSKSEEPNLNGYVVYSVAENRTQIEDIGFLGDEESFDLLIVSFIQYQSLQGIGAIGINFAGSAKWVQQLKKNGFVVRSSLSKTVLYTPHDFKLHLPQITQGEWFLTSGDNDI